MRLSVTGLSWYMHNIFENIIDTGPTSPNVLTLHQPAFGTSARLSLTEGVGWLYRCWGSYDCKSIFSPVIKLLESLRDPYSPRSYTSAISNH